MKYISLTILLSLSSLTTLAADSAKDLDDKADKAARILTKVVEEQEIPRALIKKADCMAAVTIFKGGFAGFGAKLGQGLVTCRTANGWSNPQVVNIQGANVGPQIGIGKVNMVMAFIGDEAVKQVKKRNVSGDLQLSLVAGPVGRDAMAGVDFKLDNGIYAYSSAKGLYFGATLGAALMSPDKSSNSALYKDIIKGDLSTILETDASEDLPQSFKSFLDDLKALD